MVELLDSYEGFSDCYNIRAQFPSSTNKISAMGQSIQLDGRYRLSSIKFRLQRSATGDGTLEVRVYASTGTHGTNAKPTGEVLGTSGEIDIATELSTLWTIAEFVFTGANKIILEADTVYCFELIIKVLISGTICMGSDSISPTHEGNLSGWLNSAWASTDTYDAQFWLYGSSLFLEIKGLKGEGAYGWDNTNEVHLKIKTDANGILQTS